MIFRKKKDYWYEYYFNGQLFRVNFDQGRRQRASCTIEKYKRTLFGGAKSVVIYQWEDIDY